MDVRVINEALERKDSNKDGLIDFDEYVGDYIFQEWAEVIKK